MDLLKAVQNMDMSKGLPPVEKWNPPNCGDIGMKISRDGVWFYQGSPIGRQKMVRLFSTILRRDEDGMHYLVTPVEKVPVEVEDAPFLAVEMQVEDKGRNQKLCFRTNVEDIVVAASDHPLRFTIDKTTQAPTPYIHIRGRLEARIVRSVFYDLVELGEIEKINGIEKFGVWTSGKFFALTEANKIK